MGGVFISHLGTGLSCAAALVANVTESADITLFAFLLLTTLAVGLALLGGDAVVRRIRLRAQARERQRDGAAEERPAGSPPRFRR